jgi:D-galactarolactone cycloisomerase
MKIIELKAYPTSFPVPPEDRVTLGIGRAVKRDAVVVKVTTDDGVVGWGESHHGRAPGAVAHLVNTTLRQLVLGMDAADVVGVWGRIYKTSRRGTCSATRWSARPIPSARTAV